MTLQEKEAFKQREAQAHYLKHKEDKPIRISQVRITRMLIYLKQQGYMINAWKRYDKPYWEIKIDGKFISAKTHSQAYDFIEPFYDKEKIEEYKNHLERKYAKMRESLNLAR